MVRSTAASESATTSIAKNHHESCDARPKNSPCEATKVATSRLFEDAGRNGTAGARENVRAALKDFSLDTGDARELEGDEFPAKCLLCAPHAASRD